MNPFFIDSSYRANSSYCKIPSPEVVPLRIRLDNDRFDNRKLPIELYNFCIRDILCSRIQNPVDNGTVILPSPAV